MSDHPSRIGYAQALQIIQQVAVERRLPSERLSIRRADGRVLAQDLLAPIALPAFDNSRMDGFALRHADLALAGETRLAIAGEQFAGPALEFALQPGQCVRITTGAPIPLGTDTVVIKENVLEQDGGIVVAAGVAMGADIRRAGEDVQVGDLVLQVGQRLTAPRISWLRHSGWRTWKSRCARQSPSSPPVMNCRSPACPWRRGRSTTAIENC